jgi:hypothetical protein
LISRGGFFPSRIPIAHWPNGIKAKGEIRSQFHHVNRLGLAYLHIIEPRVKGDLLIGEGQAPRGIRATAEDLRRQDHCGGLGGRSRE